MDIGTRITFFRESKGYSVNKLATLSGISQSCLGDARKQAQTLFSVGKTNLEADL